MDVELTVNPRFENFLFDWNYKTQLLLGGYGSGKSRAIATKIIIKCLQECRKVLVVREVYETIRDSCFDLLCEVLEEMNLLAHNFERNKVKAGVSPLQLNFPNGSRIIFRGLDKVEKLKSINGISIIWLEEASEAKYSGYKELRGRLRHATQSLHFILSLNPVDTQNWVYKHFFKRQDEETGADIIILDDKEFYKRKTVVVNGVYYHHSTVEDNLFLPKSYIAELDDMKNYDLDLWRVARLGEFGINGRKVLPQFSVAESASAVLDIVESIPEEFHFYGLDFGFETSYNALISVAVDDKNKYLYIYDEYYKNHMTDDETARELLELGFDTVRIRADSAEPKAIAFYRKSGFDMVKVKKFPGSVLANIKKIKRFKKIVCSPDCVNCIKELKTLVYKTDRNGEIIFDEFNVDAHTFDAIAYALDNYYVADIKFKSRHSQKGVF